MRELVYYVAVSLDGRICGPDGDFSAFPVEGDHIEMILRDYRDTISAPGLEATGIIPDRSKFDTVLMGWNTYAAGFEYTRNPYPHLRQYVFSRTRTPADVAPGIELVSTDPVELVRTLKAEDGGSGIWLGGGGQLAGALLDEVDRLILKVNPLVLGAGVPLFDTGYSVQQFELTKSTPYQSGVVVNEYQRR